MKNAIYVSVLFLLFMALAVMSYAQNADKEKIRKLIDELTTLKSAIAQEQKVSVGLGADKKLLDAQDKTIKALLTQHNKDWPVYKQDADVLKEHWSSFETDRSAFIAKWGCWDHCIVEKDSSRRQAMSEEGNPLNARLHGLKAEQKRLDAKNDELVKIYGLITDGKESLSKATLEWAAKWKASNAKMNELIAQYQKMTKIYMDLVQRARLSDECKQIAYSSDRDIVRDGVVIARQSGVIDFNDLNGAMERAHHCLQKVWDGAK